MGAGGVPWGGVGYVGMGEVSYSSRGSWPRGGGRGRGRGRGRGGRGPSSPARDGTETEPWHADLDLPEGPDLRSIELTQNIVNGVGQKMGKNQLELGMECAASGCTARLGIKQLEWKEVRMVERGDKIIVARLHAAIRNLRWCENHYGGTVEDLHELEQVMLSPPVRNALANVGKGKTDIGKYAEEGKKMRELLEKILDGRKPGVHSAVRHIRGIFLALVRAGGRSGEEVGQGDKKRKIEGVAPGQSPPSKEVGPGVIVEPPTFLTAQHTGLHTRVLMAPRTSKDIDKFPWTGYATLPWESLSMARKRDSSSVWRYDNECTIHPKEAAHYCWT